MEPKKTEPKPKTEKVVVANFPVKVITAKGAVLLLKRGDTIRNPDSAVIKQAENNKLLVIVEQIVDKIGG